MFVYLGNRIERIFGTGKMETFRKKSAVTMHVTRLCQALITGSSETEKTREKRFLEKADQAVTSTRGKLR